MLLNLKTIVTDEPGCEKAPGFSCELDLSAVKLWGEHPFSLPVRVFGNVFRRSGVLSIRYEADFVTGALCSRCLDPIERAYHKEFAHTILEEDREDYAGDEFIPAPNAELDLDELVTSDLLFELTEIPLCSEDCRGLCPKCGKNLSGGDCGCDLRIPDTRFDVLRKLLEE